MTLTRRLFSSLAQSAGKSKSKGRFFDAHTTSIWAENMAKRGAPPADAIKMLLNRMDKRGVGQRPELYNTAIDICGHNGMLMDAAQLLHRMIACNVSPNERTISSLLNTVAEHSRTLNGGDFHQPPGRTSSALVRDTESFPALDSFKVSSKAEAAQLAIKLYSSWLEHAGEKASVHPFNALLKVIWRTGSVELLTSVMPVGKLKSPLDWCPPKLDIISFTTAILACQSHPTTPFYLAKEYWIACNQAGIPIDTAISHAMLKVLLAEQKSLNSKLLKPELEQRHAVLGEISTLIMSTSSDVPVWVVNVFLEVCHRLAYRKAGLHLWKEKLLPFLETTKSMSKAKKLLDDHTIVHVFLTLLKDSNAKAIFPLWDQLEKVFGMQITPRILNVLLKACQETDDRELGESIFYHYVKRGKSALQPDHMTLYQLLTNIRYDGKLHRLAQKEPARKIIEYFVNNHREMLQETKESVKNPNLFHTIKVLGVRMSQFKL